MNELFHIIHVLIAVGLVGLILIQHGKGADAGAAFGSGASGTVFGSQGSGSFLSRATATLATGFFITCLILAYFSTQKIAPTSVISTTTEAPAAVVQEQESINVDVPMPTTSQESGMADVPVTPVQADSIKIETNVTTSPTATTEQDAATTE